VGAGVGFIEKSLQKNLHHLRGFKFTVARVRFNGFKKLVKRQFTLVLNIKWNENPTEENTTCFIAGQPAVHLHFSPVLKTH
jgi:hypothetical protein